MEKTGISPETAEVYRLETEDQMQSNRNPASREQYRQNSSFTGVGPPAEIKSLPAPFLNLTRPIDFQTHRMFVLCGLNNHPTYRIHFQERSDLTFDNTRYSLC